MVRTVKASDRLVSNFQIFKGHKAAVSIMSVDMSGKTLYTGSADSTIKSWDIQTGKLHRVRSIAVTPHTLPINVTL